MVAIDRRTAEPWSGSAVRDNRILSAAEAAWDGAGVPKRFRSCRLAGSPQATHYPELVHRLTAPWDPSRESTDEELSGWDAFWARSWFLWGPVGRGKSGLAAAYAWQWVDPLYGDPATVVWHSVPRLLASLRESYGRPLSRRAGSGETEGQILRRCREANLLVLDDLGAEHVSGSGWVEDRLYQIVSDRHGRLAPTVFTSNLSLSELNERIGERIVWRILEMAGEENIVKLDGPNLRDRGTA